MVISASPTQARDTVEPIKHERIILITYLSFIVKAEQQTFCVHGLFPIFVAPDC